ncbi:MAG: hypothetical protein ACI39Q_07285 [Wujia sp.]
MGNNIKMLTCIVSVIYGVYQIYVFIQKMNMGVWDLDSAINFIISILFVSLILCGFYGFGCLLDNIDDLRNEMMMNYGKKKKVNNSFANPMYGQNSTYQNQVYQNPAYLNQMYQNMMYQDPGYQRQSYQETGLTNNEPIDTKWECSCGCENTANSRFCINCGKQRV